MKMDDDRHGSLFNYVFLSQNERHWNHRHNKRMSFFFKVVTSPLC